MSEENTVPEEVTDTPEIATEETPATESVNVTIEDGAPSSE